MIQFGEEIYLINRILIKEMCLEQRMKRMREKYEETL